TSNRSISNEFVCDILKLIHKLPLDINHLKQNDTGRRLKKLSKSNVAKISNLSLIIIDEWKAIISANKAAKIVKLQNNNNTNGNIISNSKNTSSSSILDTSMLPTISDSYDYTPEDSTTFNESLNEKSILLDPWFKPPIRKSVSFKKGDEMVDINFFELEEDEKSY
ncbi:MAG: hypothetical protein MHPSP_002098, partial [Paramarteilia canceri]